MREARRANSLTSELSSYWREKKDEPEKSYFSAGSTATSKNHTTRPRRSDRMDVPYCACAEKDACALRPTSCGAVNSRHFDFIEMSTQEERLSEAIGYLIKG